MAPKATLSLLGKRKKENPVKKATKPIQSNRLDSFVKCKPNLSIVTKPKCSEQPITILHPVHQEVELQLVWKPIEMVKGERKQFILVQQTKPISRPLITVVESVFTDEKEGQSWYQELLKEVPWKKEQVLVGPTGIKQWQPRQSAAYSKTGKTYTYAGLMIHPYPYTPLVSSIDQRITKLLLETNPSGVHHERSYILCNGYKTNDENRDNKTDYLTSHQDSMSGLNPHAPIVSVSLGQTRWFVLQLKRHGAEKSELIRIQLRHGMMLLMHPGSQELLWHEVDESLAHLYISPEWKWRINLTARTLKS